MTREFTVIVKFILSHGYLLFTYFASMLPCCYCSRRGWSYYIVTIRRIIVVFWLTEVPPFACSIAFGACPGTVARGMLFPLGFYGHSVFFLTRPLLMNLVALEYGLWCTAFRFNLLCKM